MESEGGIMLVSLCITCFNQRRYIVESLKSAFDQDYSSLEIVISDDGSYDGTSEIVQSMISDYKSQGGRHKVLYYRNDKNVGVVKNYEKCFKLSHGDLIVTGAGDDISRADRVTRIVREWIADGRKSTVIYHGAELIGPEGEVRGMQGPPIMEQPLGAMMAYSRCIISEFPEVSVTEAYEDDVFSKRALLFGVPLVIDVPLIGYRVGTGVSTKGTVRSVRIRNDERCLASARQARLDIEFVRSRIPKEMLERRVIALDRYEAFYRAELEMIIADTVLKRFLALRRFCKNSFQPVNARAFVARLVRFVLKMRK